MALAPSALPRRERERLERRGAILAAARSLFAEKGFEQATIEEVAERAEFGKGTLYNYFPGGKDELLSAILEDTFSEMAALIRDHFEEAGDPPSCESFRDLLARIFQHYTERRDDFLLLMKEAQRLILSGDPVQTADLLRQRDEAMQDLVVAIERAMGAGVLKPYPPESVAHMLMGNVKGYLSYALAPDGCLPTAKPRLSPEDGASFMADILFDGLRAQPA